jgi:hypothetical protein
LEKFSAVNMIMPSDLIKGKKRRVAAATEIASLGRPFTENAEVPTHQQ